MSENIIVKWKKPISRVISQDAGINRRTMLFAATQWHRLYYDFVPMRTGVLALNVAYTATEKKAKIRHKAIYARRLYENRYRFSKSKHPLATHHWDKAAIAAGKRAVLAKDIKAYIKRSG